MVDYPCGKFGNCSFARFGSNVRTNRHTDTDERFTPAILVGVRKDNKQTRVYIGQLHDNISQNAKQKHVRYRLKQLTA